MNTDHVASRSVMTNKYSSLSAAEKRAHVQAYLKSNLTRQDYCERHGLKLSSFKNWPTKYGHKRTSDFAPILAAPTIETGSTSQRIEIHRGDCKVVLYDISNLPMTLEIIRGVLSCN